MRKLILPLLILVLCFSCNKREAHFLTDENYRTIVNEQFEARKIMANHRYDALFSVFDEGKLSLEQEEALKFLYAYMPLTDLADYDSDFFLKQIDGAFRTREYFSWGKSIPEEVFRHFVLVYRVNNENLDTARDVFFEELKDRVKDMSMYDAALEVNHWCHEKVIYRGTDGRTSSPLALVKTSWGRCGEESTFTATALRSVGIPARQVYTPRWVHTDSNHAWVEAWIDGKWYFLGACEPEPELNMAWFAAPAKRAMMLHTKVFGHYTGSEEKNVEKKLYSEINLLPNYTDTRIVNVYVQDVNGMPVNNSRVQFKVYNYAQMYPIATRYTDETGKVSIVSGKGDLLIWANKGERYGYKKSTPEDEVITVVLDKEPGLTFEEQFTMEVPKETILEPVDSDKFAANMIRLAHEDSIRNAYMSTFPNEDYVRDLAVKTSLDNEKLWKYISLSQGNWKEIETFVLNNADNQLLLPFLSTLTEKDLRDSPAKYLNDHLRSNYDLGGMEEDFYAAYILSPRIGIELITPWRSYFEKEISLEQREYFRNNIDSLERYVNHYVRVDNEENYYNCRITPRGVHELRIADRLSIDIYYVALARTSGIPSRINPVTGEVEFYRIKEEIWQPVRFLSSEKTDSYPTGHITIQSDSDNVVTPIYGTHYSLANYVLDDYKTLNLDDKQDYPIKMDFAEGAYRLLLGSRANDGSVTVSVKHFNLYNQASDTLTVKLPKVEGKLFVKGIIDMNTIVDGTTLKELSNGKGLMVCFLDLGKEPSVHVLQDLPKVSGDLEQWGGGVMMLSPNKKLSISSDFNASRNLPSQTVWMEDEGNALWENALEVLQIEEKDNFPLILYLNTNGGILYSSEGYKIGIGEDVLQTIAKEKQVK